MDIASPPPARCRRSAGRHAARRRSFRVERHDLRRVRGADREARSIALPGVQASVNLATETRGRGLRWRADAARAVAAVERAGYGAHVIRDAAADRARRCGAQGRASSRAAPRRSSWRRPHRALAGCRCCRCSHRRPGRTSDLDAARLAARARHAGAVLGGRRFYVGAWHALRGGGANMDVLVALGTTMAYASARSSRSRGSPAQHVYFEAGAAVITLVLLGKLLEARAQAGTSAALEGLLRLQPKTAHVARDGELRTSRSMTSWSAIAFVVRAGEAIPVDGLVERRRIERRREHADRRKHAGGQARRRSRLRRHDEPATAC